MSARTGRTARGRGRSRACRSGGARAPLGSDRALRIQPFRLATPEGTACPTRSIERFELAPGERRRRGDHRIPCLTESSRFPNSRPARGGDAHRARRSRLSAGVQKLLDLSAVRVSTSPRSGTGRHGRTDPTENRARARHLARWQGGRARRSCGADRRASPTMPARERAARGAKNF